MPLLAVVLLLAGCANLSPSGNTTSSSPPVIRSASPTPISPPVSAPLTTGSSQTGAATVQITASTLRQTVCVNRGATFTIALPPMPDGIHWTPGQQPDPNIATLNAPTVHADGSASITVRTHSTGVTRVVFRTDRPLSPTGAGYVATITITVSDYVEPFFC
jgi:hypothetical protein